MSGNGAPRILISGAAGSVGEACARLLGERGAALILADIDGIALGRLARQLGADGRVCDVASECSVRILAQETALSHGSLDVLINAAGPAYVRALGVLRLSGALLPCLGADGRRSLIVNIASGHPPVHHGTGFQHAGSPDAFSRLSCAALKPCCRV